MTAETSWQPRASAGPWQQSRQFTSSGPLVHVLRAHLLRRDKSSVSSNQFAVQLRAISIAVGILIAPSAAMFVLIAYPESW